MNVIEVRNVVKTYTRGGLFGRRKPVRAVAGVSLAVRAGSCLALVGRSGSGKSTLGRLVLGLERPDSGEVLYRGRPFHALRGAERLAARRNVQAVFQNSHGAVNPRFTARDIIAEPLENFANAGRSAITARVAGLLVDVGMDPGDMDKLPHQFSGGELQRVCLARALAPEPGLIVLDEAVSSLDMLNQGRVLEVLSRIRRERGTAFLFITHDMRLVAHCADALALMEDGAVHCLIDDLDAAIDFPDGLPPLYGELLRAVPPLAGAAVRYGGSV